MHVIQVDNVLNKVLDPLHLGMTIDRNYELTMKSIEKLDANEKMGIIGKSDGACRIIAYSEVSANLQNQKEADGKTLTFRQGCITNHVV